ncbi:MAG: HK97 family phage prohead protease [Gammaproteobacteria bacterium]|nr:HK97 family phage prohead protease [Gammaproteobacteria bacterium]
MNIEIRCAIEYRADQARLSPGHLSGVLLTYGERARDRREVFAPGSLSWPDDGVVLNLAHDRKRPVMRCTPLLEGRDVRIAFDLPDTTAGRDAAVMVRNGTLRGFSAEFVAIDEGRRDGLREIRAARLVGAGLVDDAAYGNSAEVRRSQLPPWKRSAVLWL